MSFRFKNTSPALNKSSYEAPDQPLCQDTSEERIPLQPHNPNPHIDRTHMAQNLTYEGRRRQPDCFLPPTQHKNTTLPFDHLMKPFKP